MTATPNVLLIHAGFEPKSFWNHVATCELIGKKYPAPPLGLITVAAMLPEDWPVRLVDCNIEELTDEHLEWADMALFGGMITQRQQVVDAGARARAAGVVTVIGGPDATSSPETFADFDFRVLGEAEGVIDQFVAAWRAGERAGEMTAPLHSIDVTTTPIPRYDLLQLDAYLWINVQYSRGCPFLCEFCDIIELFGRKPRTKTTPQILAELDRIYELGWRGHVDFVDDNLIGNKKAVKAFLPGLIEWQKARGHPFDLSTEASLNLADDPELLALMRDAGFFACFIGIESPDPEVLAATRKKQNTGRDIAESVRAIHKYGILVVAGFIVGFDGESPKVSTSQIALIEDCAIPIAMTGLLTVLPNTQLQRRLEAEGRLAPDWNDFTDTKGTDQCVEGLNFATLTPRVDVLREYRKVIAHVFDREAYFARLRDLARSLNCAGPSGDLRRATLFADARHLIFSLWSLTLKWPEARGPFWRIMFYTLRHNPRAMKHVLYQAANYVHLGPFSRYVISEIDRQIAEIEADPGHPDRVGFTPAVAAE